MKRQTPLLSTAIVSALMLVGGVAQASGFTYRGQLEDDGRPAEGTYDLRLTPYSDATAGVSITAPIQLRDVQVSAGRFAAALPHGLLPDDLHVAWMQVEVRRAGEQNWSFLPDRQPANLKGTACPLGWNLDGNAGTDPANNYLGTTDNQPLELRSNGQRVARFVTHTLSGPLGGYSSSVVMGSPTNQVAANVRGATIAGGGVPPGHSDHNYSDGQPNRVEGHYGAVGGGFGNQAGDQAGVGILFSAFAAVAGGQHNTASNRFATVAGGVGNTASGYASGVGGGNDVCAGASYSWAAGRSAKIRPGSDVGDPGRGCEGVPLNPASTLGDVGSFVWADSQVADFVSSGTNQFLVRAVGGALISGGIANSPEGNRLRVDGTLRVDTLGSAGATALCRNASNQIASCSSSSRYKSGIVDLELGLDTLAGLRPVAYTWTESGQADIGFVAEEVAAVDPRLVTFNAQGEVEGVRYERLSALLANAVGELAQTQQAQADALTLLRQDNAQLRAELATMRASQEHIRVALQAISLQSSMQGLAQLDGGRK
jgi:hypothetical protein